MWQIKTEIIPVVVGALGIEKGSEKLVLEKFQGTLTSGKFKRQHYWERHIFSGCPIHQADNNDKETLKCPRFKVWTGPLEKKYGLMN